MKLASKRKIEGLVIFSGGALGGLARYLLSFVPIFGTWPLMTLMINWLGAFLLAFLGAFLLAKMAEPAYWQAFLGTGFMGGFTTFGTMIGQSLHLAHSQIVVASLYLFGSLVGGLVLVRCGHLAADRFVFADKGRGGHHG